ncbi:coiled-coil domain-containing protein 97-like [Salvia splendens]|uniref:coiled-coil domain-containing protein 97-like n=1 Tax=Salvia splendens TaxID=180675 RepID=UPI001C25AAA5|nr:coiled-coil domain-containing protein 97-like [Salvia splendens]
MAKSSSDATAIGSEAKESLSGRLSLIEDLYFPRKVQPDDAADLSRRKSLLLDLLSTDAPVFLERYGSKLSMEELNHFDVLRDDYEINWHLKNLRSILSPTDKEKKSRSAKIKNRRLAYMDRLMVDGHYFSEDAMREREPYLHHEYVGKFQDPSGRSMARPGERWSETLMRRSEEAILVEKIRGEQQRLGVAQSDWVGNEREKQEEEEDEEQEEEEEEEEEEDDGSEREVIVEKEVECMALDHPSRSSQTTENHNAEMRAAVMDSLSVEEMQDRMEQFMYVMQQKFLSGEDHQHLDYSNIDEDVTLDDHWMKEANQEAEEKYFDDV